MPGEEGKPLRLDASASSAMPNLPPFLARPDDAPVYHGFTIVEETRVDGWVFGTITEYVDPDGCDYGDAFVVAPDGSRAGIIWQVDDQMAPYEADAPSERCWGVYGFGYHKPIRTTSDFVEMCHSYLPELKRRYEALKTGA